MHTRISSRVVITLLLIVVVTPAAAHAVDDALTLELQEVAKLIKDKLAAKGAQVLAVGAFSGSTNIRGGSGPEIQQKLAAALEKFGLKVVTEDFTYEVVGNYRAFVDPETELQGVNLVARLLDASGAGLAEFPRFIFGDETVPRMLGLPVQVPPAADPRERSEAFKRALSGSSAVVQGTVLRNQDKSPFGLEVQVKSSDGSYGPLAPRKNPQSGKLEVSLDKNAVYGIRLINEAPHEAAVKLTIDGLSMYAFSELGYEYIMLPARSSTLIRGWHKSNEASLEFKLVDLPDSGLARLKLKPDASTGLVAASFSAAWDKPENMPADEPRIAKGRGAATGFGQQIQQKYQEVERFIGQHRETLVVRYSR